MKIDYRGNMKVKIKITDDKTWTDETPLEFDLDDARKLWVQLGEIFGNHFPKIPLGQTPPIFEKTKPYDPKTFYYSDRTDK